MTESRAGSAVIGLNLGTKLSRYLIVGGVAALTEWSLFAMLHFRFGIDYLLAAALAFVVALAVNYVLSLRFVFVGGRHRKELELFLVLTVSLVGVGVNLGVLVLLVEAFSVHVMLSKIVGTGAGFFWNFFARHWWVFHRH